MAEKRRGLGRGLGALIPSAPVEETSDPVEAQPVAQRDDPAPRTTDAPRKQGGRPVDLFFERVTEDDVAEQPRSYSSALRSGINKNVLEAQTKRVGKAPARKSGGTRSSAQDSNGSKAEASPAVVPEEVVDGSSVGRADERPTAPAEVDPAASMAVTASPSDRGAKVSPQAPGGDQQDTEGGVDRGADHADANEGAVSRETRAKGAAILTEPADATKTVDTQGTGDDTVGLIQVPGATFADVPLDSIHPNRKQPRVEFNEDELAELVHSIREIGVLQPVVVRPSQEDGEHSYELVMGERRWRASREAGMTSIPAIIRSTLDDDLLRDALLENLHRSALNPLEEAAAYQQLLDDFGCSHDELMVEARAIEAADLEHAAADEAPPLVQRRVAAGVLSRRPRTRASRSGRRRGDGEAGAEDRGRGAVGAVHGGDRRAEWRASARNQAERSECRSTPRAARLSGYVALGSVGYECEDHPGSQEGAGQYRVRQR